MIDSHAHLNHPDLETDLEEVLERAAAAGLQQMLVPGYDLSSSRRAVELAEDYPQILAAVGVHPHDAAALNESALEELRRLASSPRVAAIGEIGLDFYRDLSPREIQLTAFAMQLRLARELNLPVIIHQREAEQAAREVFLAEKSADLGGVWHCFSGSEELVDFVIEQDFYIGIGGSVTFPNARGLAAIVSKLPLEHLLLETDCPYLSPHPHRGQRNEPARLPIIARKIAELTGEPVERISQQTTANFERTFTKEAK